jgi:hypothetical protein
VSLAEKHHESGDLHGRIAMQQKGGTSLFRNLPPDPLAREERDHKLVVALVRLEPERLVNNLAAFCSFRTSPPNRDLVPPFGREPIKLPPEPTAEPFQPLERDLGPFKQLGRERHEVRRSVDPRRTRRRERHFVDGRPIGGLHLRDLQRRQLGRGGVRGRVGPEEELGVPVSDGGAEGGAVRREFGERFAEPERGRAGAVDGQGEVVRRDGRDDVRRQGFDLFEGGGGVSKQACRRRDMASGAEKVKGTKTKNSQPRLLRR